jgi:hypothetical protein
MTSRRGAPAPSEKAIQAAVLDHWRALGLPGTLVAAIPNAHPFGQPGLTPGLFDLLVVAPGLPVAFIELKTEPGRLSRAQESFRLLLKSAGVPCAVTYGRDEPIAVLEAWKVVRRAAA